MDTNEHPLLYIKEQWQRAPLELLIPAALGLGLLQLAVALLVFLSASFWTFALCFALTLFAAGRAALFLRVLLRNSRTGVTTALQARDLQLLLGSLIGAVGLYALLGPNTRLGIFFALMSLPHFLSLIYLAKRHTAYVAAPATTSPLDHHLVPGLQRYVDRGRAYGAALRTQTKTTFSTLVARVRLTLATFRENPDFRSS